MKDIFLTFDMDWAIDEVLEDFYQLIKEYQVKATVHVTHQTRYIETFRQDDAFEIGIHPNFNRGLQGDAGNSADKTLGDMKAMVPEAVCCRGHALTTSSLIVTLYDKYGIKYDLNHIVEPVPGMKLSSYQAQSGAAQILPFIFEDDVYISRKNRKPIAFYLGEEFDAPRIFNFHPQHLFLNTVSPEMYDATRPYYKCYSRLQELRNTKERGVRDIFADLIRLAKKEGNIFKKISEGDWVHS